MTDHVHGPTIDVHCHLATPAAAELLAPHKRPEYDPYNYFMGQDSHRPEQGDVPHDRATPRMPRHESRTWMPWDGHPGLCDVRVGVRLLGAASVGAERQGCRTTTWPRPCRRCPIGSRLRGDRAAPRRRLAIAEMDRAVDELGFKGLQIGGTVDGHNLDEPRFRPFWQAVAAKGIPVIIHPERISRRATGSATTS